MNKYAQLFDGSEYVEFGKTPQKEHKHVFAFLIPHHPPDILEKYKPTIVMTVCETYPVHESYRTIFERFPFVLVPSQFCKDIFKKQFPGVRIEVFPHWPGSKKTTTTTNEVPGPYTFYTIGNIADPRKNIDMLLDTFIQCKFAEKGARLVIKATCKEPIQLKIPGVLVLNGLIPDDQLERIHAKCHCYVNCSHSEGVGMGAVEAAIRNKPVIITDFGGLKEYVKTPFVIECTETKVGMYDFLFEPHMIWGNPSREQLEKYMTFCFEKDIRTWDHRHTREFTDSGVLRTKFSNFSLALTGSPVEILGATDGNGDDDGDWVRL